MKNPSEIEREIEDTRERMSQDIDAIGEKFSPSHIKERAREKLHDAREAAMEKVQEVAGDVGRKTKEAGNSLMDAVKRNPVPAAMIGAGVAWLIAEGRKDTSRSRRYNRGGYRNVDYPYGRSSGVGDGQGDGETSMGDRASEAMHTVKDKAQNLTSQAGEKFDQMREQAGEKFDQLKEQAGDKAREYQEEMRGFYEENPLIAAAAIAVLGAAIGALIPRTAPEEKYLGPVGDKLIEKVKDTASDATERAKGAAQEAVDSFTEAFSASGQEQQQQQRGSSSGQQRQQSGGGRPESSEKTQQSQTNRGTMGGGR